MIEFIVPIDEKIVPEEYIDAMRKRYTEIIRCEDCKFYQDNNGGYPTEECKWRSDETPDMEDYCSLGERK